MEQVYRLHLMPNPETDGQTERVNQCLEIFLRCFVHACPRKWSKWLALAEFWYNTAHHSALGRSPFKVLYGNEPRYFGIEAADTCPVDDLQVWLEERQNMSELLRQHLNYAKQKMKKQTDQRRTAREFSVGEQVFLKLQPYVQSSVAVRANHKLSFRYFGPFPIAAKVGSVAYRLQLPEQSQVHPVFHVSQLKKALPSHRHVSSILPSDDNALMIPIRFWEHRWLQKGNKNIRQVLTQWSGHPDSSLL